MWCELKCSVIPLFAFFLNLRQEELGTGFLPWAYIHATFPPFHQAWTSGPESHLQHLNKNVTSSKPVHALISLHFWHHPLHYWQHLPPLSTPLTPSSPHSLHFWHHLPHTLCTTDTTFPHTFTKSFCIMDVQVVSIGFWLMMMLCIETSLQPLL